MKRIPQLTEIQQIYFRDRVDIRGSIECWPWIGNVDKKGYGRAKLNSVMYQASRVAYYLQTGIDPETLFVCHTCDNPICVNPIHLWLGTTQDNTLDRDTKGRTADKHGSKHHLTKFTETQVLDIRNQFSKGKSQTALGRQFGVNQPAIGKIVRRKTWTHI